MNSEQARFILRAFRPGLDRRDSPEFAEAFEQLQHDPELARWFEQEMAVDAAIRRKLSEAVPVPDALKHRIAAIGRITRPAARSWWHRPGLLALAASIVLLALFGASQFMAPSRQVAVFAEFRTSIVQDSLAKPHITFMDSSRDRIQAHLRSTRAPDVSALPPALARASLKGCRVLEWNGTQVSLLCLYLTDGRHVDLLIVRDVLWDPAGPGANPVFARVGSVNTASWSSNGHTYILTSDLPEEELLRLLTA